MPWKNRWLTWWRAGWGSKFWQHYPQPLHWVVGGAVFGILLFFPFRYPAITVERDPDPGRSFLLAANQPFSQEVVVPTSFFSGVVLWTNPSLAISYEVPLTLTVTDAERGRVVREIHTQLGRVLYRSNDSLRFQFWPLHVAPEHPYRVTLTLSSGSAAGTLPLRYALDNDPTAVPHVALRALKTQPLVVTFLQRVFEHGADGDGEDIVQHWRRGGEILSGHNPYSCLQPNAVCSDNKNPIHFPLFYWLAAGTRAVGFDSYSRWLLVWEYVFFLFYVAIGGLLFGVLIRRGGWLLAFFGMLFWLFNRWSLYVLQVHHIDFIALFFFVWALVVLPRRQLWALFLLSLSIATKQVALPLVPIFFIYYWQTSRLPWRRRLGWGLLAVAVVPVLITLPFFIDTPGAVLRGLLFPITRNTQADFGAPAFDAFIRNNGKSRNMVMFALMGVVFAAFGQKSCRLSPLVCSC